MKDGLVSLLLNESTVNAICGSRIYVGKAKQKAEFPYVIITQMSSEENGSLDGGSGQLRFINYEIDCKALTSVKAEQLSTAVRVFLDDYSGAAGSYTIGAVVMNDESDDYEPPQDGSDIGVHVVTLDLDVQFNT